MNLIVVLLLLVLLTGGAGFTGVVALGSFSLIVQILFAVLLIMLLISVIRHLSASGGDPLI